MSTKDETAGVDANGNPVVVPTCARCARAARGWPLKRGDRCSPRGWVHCMRDPHVVMAENAAG